MHTLKLIRPTQEYADQVMAYRQEMLDNGDSLDVPLWRIPTATPNGRILRGGSESATAKAMCHPMCTWRCAKAMTGWLA